ncbi:peptidase S41 [Halorhodospira abdelmalekii]|uniref:carboxy terminal-processing peptidase n=1 Tax=Halorhodospira abdelmalekii TaxID=421629 RepID=UPI001902ECFB|nr:carboxy terminal-processing peptidase [Halorhodospira abdelmalekii]MBK1735007.1 peptidase S41 [Halorhodospira abdelmalekii]
MARTTLRFIPALLLVAALIGVPLSTLPTSSPIGADHSLAAVASAEDSAAPLTPGEQDYERARVIGQLLEAYHYGQRSDHDNLVRAAADAYLKRLDPGRFFLLAEDVERFRGAMRQTDDKDPTTRLEAAFELYATYQARVTERIDWAFERLHEDDIEIDADERFEQDRRKADWAEDRSALDRLWEKRIAHDMLTLELADRDSEQIRDNLERRYRNLLERAQDAEREEVAERYLDAWAAAFDPHSGYFSPRRSEEFDMEMSLELEGIGAKLTMEQDMTEIVELIPGGPAERSGKLQAGERIIGVADGEEGEMKDIVGWMLHDVVQLIRGPKESTVRLKVLPPSGASDSSPREITLVRNKVALEDQAARKQIIEKPYEDGIKRIGVIEIPRFYRDFGGAQAGAGDFRSTTRDVQALLDELNEEEIDGLVIDLRGNSGGALQEAIGVTSLFTGGGVAVQVRHHDGNIDRLGQPQQEPHYSGPLAVMVNRRSASASEILAGAIQDYGRGVVLGDQTFGKGTVQHMIDLGAHGITAEGGGAGRLKLTIAQFYRVSGEGTQLDGITPDIELPSLFDHETYGERAAENPLPANRIAPLQVEQHFDLGSLIGELRQLHEDRIGEHAAFRALQEEMEYQRELRRETHIALDRDVRQAERDRREQRLLELHNAHRQAYGLEPVESYQEVDPDELPDTLLKAGAAVVRDLTLLLEAEEEVALGALSEAR